MFQLRRDLIVKFWERSWRLIRIFTDSRRYWTLPKQKLLCLIDPLDQDFFCDNYPSSLIHKLFVRGEEIYVPLMVLAIFNRNIINGFWFSYIYVFLRCSQTQVAITFIDNNKKFYLLSNLIAEMTTVFIQNGKRGGGGDIFYSLKHDDRYHVDYKFVFNRFIGEYFDKYISGETIVLGSFKNNNIARVVTRQKSGVVFISSYRGAFSNEDPCMRTDCDGVPISWKYYSAFDKHVLKIVGDWCKKNSLKLTVVGTAKDTVSRQQELNWYVAAIGDDDLDWAYSQKMDSLDNYRIVDGAELVVSAGSTLGYESFARGNKTCLIGRSIWLNDPQLAVGWPSALEETGPFWTNKADANVVSQTLDFSFTATKTEWDFLVEQYREHFVEMDAANTQLTKTIDRLIIEAKKNVWRV